MNERDVQKLEAVQMRLLRPWGLTRLDRQRNPDICNISKVDNITQGVQKVTQPMAYLESVFPGRLISKRLWPPRSQDLSPLDLFLWGASKGYSVFKSSIHTVKIWCYLACTLHQFYIMGTCLVPYNLFRCICTEVNFVESHRKLLLRNELWQSSFSNFNLLLWSRK
jgi:hypothetical protein